MPAFRQVGEKQLPQEVVFMAWSPKRDLIALANRAGEVLLHRLANFQRVWSLPPNENTGKEVTALAWRPDGKILAFGLTDTKRIILCDVEKPESLHSFSVDSSITYMHWMEVTEESSALVGCLLLSQCAFVIISCPIGGSATDTVASGCQSAAGDCECVSLHNSCSTCEL
uniref:Anaphase promoting complex subunit 4 n=1 Tax=Apteryx owenii TaxID=8824 RepID=A0A8B9QIT8_APTOW